MGDIFILLGPVNQKEASQGQQQTKACDTSALGPFVDVAGGEPVFRGYGEPHASDGLCGRDQTALSARRRRTAFFPARWLPWFESAEGFVSRLEQDFLFSSEEAIALQSQVFRRFILRFIGR